MTTTAATIAARNAATTLATYRRLNPRSRRRGSVAIVKSGSQRTMYGCVCGAIHTAATRYRGTTAHERAFFAGHRDCMERLVAGQQ